MMPAELFTESSLAVSRRLLAKFNHRLTASEYSLAKPTTDSKFPEML